MRIRHSSHDFGWQSSHSVDLAGWQAKMASIEIVILWRNAHKPHCVENCIPREKCQCPYIFSLRNYKKKKGLRHLKNQKISWGVVPGTPPFFCILLQYFLARTLPKKHTHTVIIIRVGVHQTVRASPMHGLFFGDSMYSREIVSYAMEIIKEEDRIIAQNVWSSPTLTVQAIAYCKVTNFRPVLNFVLSYFWKKY